MRSTTSRHDDFLTFTNRASLHVRIQGKWTALARRNADGQSPAGGVSSTARDLAQWMRLELAGGDYNGKPLIQKEAIAQTHVPLMDRGKHPVYGVPAFYGLGWNVEYRRYGAVWGHAGAFSQGARTLVSLVPSEALGIIVLTGAFPTGVPEGIADAFLAEVLGGDTARDWVGDWNKAYRIALRAGDRGRQGHLRSPARERIARAGEPGLHRDLFERLFAHGLGRGRWRHPDAQPGPPGYTVVRTAALRPRSVVYYPYDEMPDLPVAATFAIGADGKAARLVLDDLNDNGQGVLVRTDGSGA